MKIYCFLQAICAQLLCMMRKYPAFAKSELS
jgi:hypothetical protein